MLLKRVRIKNFRSIREVTVDIGSQMAIVGGNGTGKSSVLRAIDRFFGASTTIELDDFFGRQVEEPIEIGLTFTGFNDLERKMFGARIHNDEMIVVRVFEASGGKNNGRYYGATMQHPGFAPIRSAEGAAPKRTAYNQLRQSGGDYSELPPVSRAEQISEALAAWLSGELTGTLQQFYKEASVALRWQPTEDFAVPLPAADVLLNDDGFEGPVDRKGHGLQRAFILTLLQHLAKATSADEARKQTSPPTAPVDSDTSAADASKPAEEAEPAATYTIPGLILAIEEPELYQHPTKQRHFAKVLSQLSVGELPGVARHTQVLFATHSSLFVSMDRFDEVRLARRHKIAEGEHKECRLTYSMLSDVARRLERAYGKEEGTFTGDGLKARLHIIDAEVAEGLFADTVVLVEGVCDRAAIVAAAALEDIDLEAQGIAVLAVDGKTKMDRPAAIFTSLGIPTYLVWDCDRQLDGAVEGVDQNRALQALMGVPGDQIVDAATILAPTFACFETQLETVIKKEIGAGRAGVTFTSPK